MKKMYLILFCTITVLLCGDFKEKKRVSVDFPKFGVYQSDTDVFYKGLEKREDNNVTVQGRGLFGSMLANFFPKGKTIKLTNLNENMQYDLKTVEQTYTKSPIQKIFESEETYETEDDYEETEEYEEASSYDIIRKKFNVENAGEKDINDFKTTHYTIEYVIEVQNKETMDRKIDSLFVHVFSTKQERKFEQAGAEKASFQKAYFNAIGMKEDASFYDDIVGMKWITMMQSMGDEEQPAELDLDYNKLKKIEGTPVLVDGTYHIKSIKKDSDDSDSTSLSSSLDLGSFGGLASAFGKKASKKMAKKGKQKSQFKKMLGYRVETIELSTDNLKAATFEVPAGYQEIVVPGQGY